MSITDSCHEENPFLSLDITHKTVQTNKTDIKVYCLSDIHVDVLANMEWVRTHCTASGVDPSTFRVFICAGDISANIDRVKDAFQLLSGNYDAVCFVPGNHDVWTRPNVEGDTSLLKLQDLIEVAGVCGVHMGPITVYSSELSRNILHVIPLYSWYHSDWDTERDIPRVEEVPFSLKWMDFRRCKWPDTTVQEYDFVRSRQEKVAAQSSVSSMFAQINQPFIETLRNSLHEDLRTPVISFSHFLPRIELCPEKRFLSEPLLPKVIGSNILEAQVRALRPELHVFGHTHIPIDMVLEGQRYLQWPLGYIREATQACAPIRRINGPLLAYQSDNKRNISFVPADIPSRNVFWSRYYGENAREGVALEVLAPEAVERLKAVSIDSKCVDCRGVITLAATECLCCAQEAAPEKK